MTEEPDCSVGVHTDKKIVLFEAIPNFVSEKPGSAMDIKRQTKFRYLRILKICMFADVC